MLYIILNVKIIATIFKWWVPKLKNKRWFFKLTRQNAWNFFYIYDYNLFKFIYPRLYFYSADFILHVGPNSLSHKNAIRTVPRIKMAVKLQSFYTLYNNLSYHILSSVRIEFYIIIINRLFHVIVNVYTGIIRND